MIYKLPALPVSHNRSSLGISPIPAVLFGFKLRRALETCAVVVETVVKLFSFVGTELRSGLRSESAPTFVWIAKNLFKRLAFAGASLAVSVQKHALFCFPCEFFDVTPKVGREVLARGCGFGTIKWHNLSMLP